MTRLTFAVPIAAGLFAGLSFSSLAASPVTAKADQETPAGNNVGILHPAQVCLNDLRTFDSQMEKDGYWLSGYGYGYGYPMDGFGYGYTDPIGAYPSGAASNYRLARPGYEVRVLIASANILARQGQQQPCEDVLSTTRKIYKLYAADMHKGGARLFDAPRWREKQISAAQPVADSKRSFRADELVGTDVRNAKNDALGSVEDIIMSPQTGKIAYLVVERGGIFGIDEKYVPVPWEQFKVTPNSHLLVLDTTKVAMEAAPRVDDGELANPPTSISRARK